MARLELSPEDLEKVKRLKEQHGEYHVDYEFMILAEVGMYFGWAAIKDIVNNDVKDMNHIYELVRAARKLRAKGGI